PSVVAVPKDPSTIGVASTLLASIFQEAAIACFIALLLGLTIDTWVKHEIARDVFEAVLGYRLHPALSEELIAITSNRLICVEHSEKIDIKRIDHAHDVDAICVTVERTRRLQNTGQEQK